MTPYPNRWTSRPFLLTLASIVTLAAGVAVILGAPPEKANAIAGLLISGLTAVAMFNGFELTKDKVVLQSTIEADIRKIEARAQVEKAETEAKAAVEVARVAAVAEKATAAATVDVAEVQAEGGQA